MCLQDEDEIAGTGPAQVCFQQMLLLLICFLTLNGAFRAISGGKRGSIQPDATFKAPARLFLCLRFTLTPLLNTTLCLPDEMHISTHTQSVSGPDPGAL